MPLPQGISRIRVHPSIGFARLSPNADTFVFGQDPGAFKSNGLIKRQSVQFRLFAYGAAGEGIEELTPSRLAQLGLGVNWRATVANRKIATERNDPAFVISATATSNSDGGRLVGRCGDFQEGQQIELGEMRADGVFVPPVARVFREASSTPVPDSGMFSGGTIADNTCDGPVTADVFDAQTGTTVGVEVVPAWLFITPPDFAPDWDDLSGLNLYIRLKTDLGIGSTPPATPVNAAARQLDQESIECGTAKFSPGIEMNRPRNGAFYPPGALGEPAEIRLRIGTLATTGIAPGELTANLCSPWQFDFRACTCTFWPNQRPDTAQKDAPTGPHVQWLRKRAADASPSPAELDTNPEFIAHVFKLGIIRKQNDLKVETERTNDIP